MSRVVLEVLEDSCEVSGSTWQDYCIHLNAYEEESLTGLKNTPTCTMQQNLQNSLLISQTPLRYQCMASKVHYTSRDVEAINT